MVFPHAVSNAEGVSIILAAVIVVNFACVRNYFVTEAHGEFFRETQVPAGKWTPLSALPISSVGRTDNFLTEGAWQRSKQGGASRVIVPDLGATVGGVQS